MEGKMSHKIAAAVLSMALMLPATSAFANTWSKKESRTRGTAIGAAAGALLGPVGALAGAAIGNGVQAGRHAHHSHTASTHHVRRHQTR